MTVPVLEAPGIHRVDLAWNGLPGQVAGYLVEDGDALAVVECGPGSTLPALLAGIRALDRDPATIEAVLVTHVHLDHAGAAGALLRLAPRARVHVHPLGAPHLADPARLLASASLLYGTQMQALWGSMLPVSAQRVNAVPDGGEVRVGRRRLRALATPGHARHHHAWLELDSGALFSGDVGGIRLGAAPYVCAPTPPPEIDLPAWRDSLGRLRAAAPARLLLTHFGAVTDVDWHLAELEARLAAWAGWMPRQAASGIAGPALAEAMRLRAEADILAAGGDAAVVEAYARAVPYGMMAAGLERWWRRLRTPASAPGNPAPQP